ncbi:hypothetical protein JTB14_036401 [Gonioctena quinquepunctata]|nr:hypothetical protein JTB14_036401 [Gonioctena quinquepunctata]
MRIHNTHILALTVKNSVHAISNISLLRIAANNFFLRLYPYPGEVRECRQLAEKAKTHGRFDFFSVGHLVNSSRGLSGETIVQASRRLLSLYLLDDTRGGDTRLGKDLQD